MGPHIDTVVKKCHGLLGMLRRSAHHLPLELIKLIYIAVIRTRLEYCSSIFINAAPTHLTKLDIIQKIAARIIVGVPSQSHSAPILLQLGLDSLHIRRQEHVTSLVENIFKGNSHPYFKDFFSGIDCPVLATSHRTKFSKIGRAHV